MISDSRAVYEQFKKHQIAKDTYRKMDTDERIKKALKSRGYEYHDEIKDIGKPIKKWDSDIELEIYTKKVVAKEVPARKR